MLGYPQALATLRQYLDEVGSDEIARRQVVTVCGSRPAAGGAGAWESGGLKGRYGGTVSAAHVRRVPAPYYPAVVFFRSFEISEARLQILLYRYQCSNKFCMSSNAGPPSELRRHIRRIFDSGYKVALCLLTSHTGSVVASVPTALDQGCFDAPPPHTHAGKSRGAGHL